MKQLIIPFLLLFTANTFAQNVGIGITTPDEKLQVDSVIRIGKNAIIPTGSTRKNTIKFGDGNFATIGEQDKDDRLVLNAGSFSFRSGNVGVGLDSAKEKLDVAGNANFTGQLKLNSNAGLANQILMKDGSNNPVWGDMSDYKNAAVFISASLGTTVAGANNLLYTWTVPATVTNILVQAWSGGGGGGNLTGGGGGGYMTFLLPVTPSDMLTIVVGSGGGGGTTSTNGIIGGITSIATSTVSCNISGGSGGFSGDASTSFVILFHAASGGVLSNGGIPNVEAYIGSYGKPTTMKFEQVSATEFVKVFTNGDGGDAPLWPGSGGKGGYSISSTLGTFATNASNTGAFVGGGGGSDYSGGKRGLGGKVIIRY